MRARSRSVVIGGGSLKGRALRYPDAADVRPSTQLAKNSLFATLADRLTGAVFADLYAGAGGVGIEALSRGAAFVHFVEHEREVLRALAENLAACAVDRGDFRVHANRVEALLDATPCPIADAAIVFADPPYAADVEADLLARMRPEAFPVLEVLIVEHASRREIVPPPAWLWERSRRFGDTTLTYLKPARAV